MRTRVILKGTSRYFAGNFKRMVEDCGFLAVLGTEAEETDDLAIYEINDRAELGGLLKRRAPYLIFTLAELDPGDLAPLKEKGLMGVLNQDSSPETVSMMANNAFFCGKLVKRNLRAPLKVPVELSSGAVLLRSTTTALSRDGMFILTLNPLGVNSLCEVSFTLPGTEVPIRTGARVIYCIRIDQDLNIITNQDDRFKRIVTHPGMAVYFTTLPQEKRDAIEEYLKSLG